MVSISTTTLRLVLFAQTSRVAFVSKFVYPIYSSLIGRRGTVQILMASISRNEQGDKFNINNVISPQISVTLKELLGGVSFYFVLIPSTRKTQPNCF